MGEVDTQDLSSVQEASSAAATTRQSEVIKNKIRVILCGVNFIRTPKNN